MDKGEMINYWRWLTCDLSPKQVIRWLPRACRVAGIIVAAGVVVPIALIAAAYILGVTRIPLAIGMLALAIYAARDSYSNYLRKDAYRHYPRLRHQYSPVATWYLIASAVAIVIADALYAAGIGGTLAIVIFGVVALLGGVALILLYRQTEDSLD